MKETQWMLAVLHVKHGVKYLVLIPAAALYLSFQVIGNSTVYGIPVQPDVVDMSASTILELGSRSTTILVGTIACVLRNAELRHEQTVTLMSVVVCCFVVVLTAGKHH
jgi:hypothetical protein